MKRTTIEPGTRVRIIQDCRDGAPATGQHGIYEGDFPLYIMVQFDGEIKEMSPWEYATASVTVDGKDIPLSDASPIYQGETPPPPDGGDFSIACDNPRIQLDSGGKIWGIECWWDIADKVEDLAKAQEEVEQFKEVLRAMAESELKKAD